MKLIALLAALLFLIQGVQAQDKELSGRTLEADFSGLTAKNHPRLVYDADDFKRLEDIVAKGENKDICMLHQHVIAVADRAVKSKKPLEFKKDASGKRILTVSRDALGRLASCAYAYRLTGDKKYLKKAEEDLLAVCSFESWNPRHYLDVAEMSAGVAMAYDWLYQDLKKSTRKEVVRALRDYALKTCRDQQYTWWYKRIGNWNQVCNAGLVCAAIAIYEHCPELAREVMADAVKTNRPAIEGIYGPDGAYPEGATYWGFGTVYQVLMLTAMENALGTDFGLSQAPGFLETGTFKIFSTGTTGKAFNFADNVLGASSSLPLWYFVAKKQAPSMLFQERELLKSDKYHGSGHKGLLTLSIRNAMDIKSEDSSTSAGKFYSAQGKTPVMMCRSGWEKNDHYLGIKGGQDGYLHGHMDCGSFVYDAYGVRWAVDLVRQNYAVVEVGMKKVGGKLADYSQNSLRWKLFRNNCRQHNTLTVNDKDHNVKAFVNMTAVENTPERMAATFDLAPLFDGDLSKAERTAALCDESYLEVRDVLAAPSDRPALVRWTFVTEAVPQVTPDGIILEQKGIRMLLRTEGGKVNYRTWSADPKDYDNPVKEFDEAVPGVSICGFEVEVPAASELTLTTTLKKL